ncbi:hypothetical protein BJ508DRAFT_219102, partial [Ascobolus immersus RN42]
MKAVSWFSWVLQQSPVFLYGLLPDNHYRGYLCFVKAARLCAYGWDITDDDVDEIDRLITEFLEYYETHIYKLRWKRLSACRPVIHQLKHVAQTIRILGPMSGYTQFPIERFI